ncbi:hypothetical protein N2152v2_000401 [Parachlorella kessleri]
MSSVVLATAGYDHSIRFWEATSGICYRTLQYADSQVNKLEITSDKTLVAAAGNPHIRLFEVNSNNPQPVLSYDGHTTNVTAVGFQRGGQCMYRGRVMALCTPPVSYNSHALRFLACRLASSETVGFQRDGKWMYSGSEDGTVKIWDLRAPGCQREYESRAAVNTVILHPNQGELLSGDAHGNIRVWDLTANACSCELVPEVGTAVRSLTVAMDGSLMVAANNNGTCYVWRAMRGSFMTTHFEPLHKLKAHQGYVLKCLLSPDVRQLATTSSDKTVKLWNLDGFTLDRTLTGHQRWVWDCVFSVDAAYLVTASSDCTARLWDLSNGEAIRVYSGHHKACVTCALNDSAVEGQDRE